ncbi:hypothetical protein FRB99_003960, partial [Tulasnella sp. 403]
MSTSSPVVAAQALVEKPQPPTAVSNEHPTTPTTTHAPFSKSSPTRKGRFYAEHKLTQVQRFGYHKETHKKADFGNTYQLFKFLETPEFDQLPNVPFDTFGRSDFLAKANSMSESIKKEYFKDLSGGLVVFNDTESKEPRGHLTDTKCRPDITAAFEGDFGDKGTT